MRQTPTLRPQTERSQLSAHRQAKRRPSQGEAAKRIGLIGFSHQRDQKGCGSKGRVYTINGTGSPATGSP